jgi:uncharacterized protein YacL
MLKIFRTSKKYRVLDTSILIDGRIYGIIECGFLDGDIIVPSFVVDELQKMADSKDHEKRKKGQRGLEYIQKIQSLVPVEIWSKKIEEIESVKEVDTKVVLLCKEIEAKLLTLDYGLNKIAKIHGVIVLNINDLYNSIRPQFYSGQKIRTKIIKEGTQDNQGFARWEEDGTTIVVENGKQHIGKKVLVEVLSVYQNQSARIVFTKFLEVLNG